MVAVHVDRPRRPTCVDHAEQVRVAELTEAAGAALQPGVVVLDAQHAADAVDQEVLRLRVARQRDASPGQVAGGVRVELGEQPGPLPGDGGRNPRRRHAVVHRLPAGLGRHTGEQRLHRVTWALRQDDEGSGRTERPPGVDAAADGADVVVGARRCGCGEGDGAGGAGQLRREGGARHAGNPEPDGHVGLVGDGEVDRVPGLHLELPARLLDAVRCAAEADDRDDQAVDHGAFTGRQVQPAVDDVSGRTSCRREDGRSAEDHGGERAGAVLEHRASAGLSNCIVHGGPPSTTGKGVDEHDGHQAARARPDTGHRGRSIPRMITRCVAGWSLSPRPMHQRAVNCG